MSTRSRIAARQADGTFRSIYCHSSGYPGWVGRVLAAHYTDPEKVERLIALGDLSSLREEIGERHPFSDLSVPDCRWCVAYGRDRGEEGTGAEDSADFEALLELTQGCWGEYLYVFEGGRWRCFAVTGAPLAVDLEDASSPRRENHTQERRQT
jgi:hypothetical protein